MIFAVEKGAMSGTPPNPEPSELSVRQKKDSFFTHSFAYFDIWRACGTEARQKAQADAGEQANVSRSALKQVLNARLVSGPAPLFHHRRWVRGQMAVLGSRREHRFNK